MSSKTCWSLPGLSTERRLRRIRNRTIMIAATTICITMKSAQGSFGSAAVILKRASNQLPRPARYSLKSFVSQTSCVVIFHEFEDDFEYGCRWTDEETAEHGADTKPRIPEYNKGH